MILLALLLLWSVCFGLGLAQATEPWFAKTAEAPTVSTLPELLPELAELAATPRESQPVRDSGPITRAALDIGTVDVVGDRYQAGQTLYLQTCATCHLAIPPAVLPSETWRQLLLDPQHYGATLTPLQNPNLRLVWDYLKTYSRPEAIGENVPYRLYQSRYFQILHPKVKLPTRIGLANCLSCHPGAGDYNFRKVSAEWQNAP